MCLASRPTAPFFPPLPFSPLGGIDCKLMQHTHTVTLNAAPRERTAVNSNSTPSGHVARHVMFEPWQQLLLLNDLIIKVGVKFAGPEDLVPILNAMNCAVLADRDFVNVRGSLVYISMLCPHGMPISSSKAAKRTHAEGKEKRSSRVGCPWSTNVKRLGPVRDLLREGTWKPGACANAAEIQDGDHGYICTGGYFNHAHHPKWDGEPIGRFVISKASSLII